MLRKVTENGLLAINRLQGGTIERQQLLAVASVRFFAQQE